MAIDWVHAGIYYAMADAGQRGQADAGIVALFSLARMLTFADGLVIGIAVVAISLLAMLSGTLPWPLVWLGFVMGGFPLVETPIQLAINHSAGGRDRANPRAHFAGLGRGGRPGPAHQADLGRPGPGFGAGCCDNLSATGRIAIDDAECLNQTCTNRASVNARRP